MNRDDPIYHVEGIGWYVKTMVSAHGPFETRAEAMSYLTLLSGEWAARVTVGWLQDQEIGIED